MESQSVFEAETQAKMFSIESPPRLEKKELLLRKLVEENSKSVMKAQAAERRQTAQVAQTQMLQMSLNKMREAAASQTKVIDDLTNALDQLRYVPQNLEL